MGKKYLIALHRGPDFDCVTCRFMIELAYNIGPEDEVQVVFVEHGKMYESPVSEDTTVIHADTGGILDPMQNCFDHHNSGNLLDEEISGRDCDPSSANAIFNAFPNRFRHDQLIQALVNLTNRVDSGHREQRENQDQDTRNELITKIRSINIKRRTKFWLSEFQDPKEPRHIVTMFYQLMNLFWAGKLSELQALDMAVAALEAWYFTNSTLQHKLETLMSDAELVENNGLRIMILPDSDLWPKMIRYHIRSTRRWRDMVDVWVTHNPKEKKFGITCMSEDLEHDLKKICRLIKGVDPNLTEDDMHLESFVLYVNETKKITPSLIRQAVLELGKKARLKAGNE